MFEYIRKFNSLPSHVRERIAASGTVEKVEELEKEFSRNLAPVIMKVIVGDLKFEKLKEYLINNFDLEEKEAKELKARLREEVFAEVADYVSIEKEEKEEKEKEEKEKEEAISSEEDSISPEEKEEEIRVLEEKMKDYHDFDPLRAQIDRKAEKVMEEGDISFSSEFLRNRVKNIIIIYLKSVRNQANTVQALTKPVTSGGGGLDSPEADKLLSAAKGEKMDLEEEPRFHPTKLKYKEESEGELTEYEETASALKKEEATVAKKEKGAPEGEDSEKSDISQVGKEPGIDMSQLGGERDINYDLKSVLDRKHPQEQASGKEEEKEEKRAQEGERGEKRKEEQEEKGLFSRLLSWLFGAKDNRNNERIEEEKKEKGKTEIKKKEAPPKEEERVPDRIATGEKEAKKNDKGDLKKAAQEGAQEGGKKKVEDIKPAPKVMDPIDELRYMDVTAFRRLAEKEGDRAEKIKKKINLLGKESLDKKLKGVSAWRRSPASEVYLAMGRESINKGQDIKKVIEQRRKNDKEYLTEKEFNIVLDLNKDLRFY